MNRASSSWSTIPQPIVRQFTARKLLEKNAVMPRKQATPSVAWPRGPIQLCKRYASTVSVRTIRPISQRQLGGVAGTARSGDLAEGTGSRFVPIGVVSMGDPLSKSFQDERLRCGGRLGDDAGAAEQ